MKHRSDDTDGTTQSNSHKNLSRCQHVYHETHMDWHEIDPGSLSDEGPASNNPQRATVLRGRTFLICNSDVPR